jgi:signal transduction histidine kinase
MTLHRKTLLIFGITLVVLLGIMYGAVLVSLNTFAQPYAQPQSSINNLTFSFVAFGVGFFVLFLLILDKLVLSRLGHFCKTVGYISRTGDISKRVSIKGNDELSDLGDAINILLTSLQTSKNKLHDIEATNRAMLEAIPDSIFQFTKNGKVKVYELDADDGLPISHTKAADSRLHELMPVEAYRQALSHMNQALRTGDVQVFDYPINREGATHDYEVRMVKSGKDSVLTIVRDITEQKQAEETMVKSEEEIDQRTHELQVVIDELESFAYSVSHDLRAPLRSIEGFSHILLEGYVDKLDDEGKDYLQRLRASSQHMSELIDDLLNLSRVTRGDMRNEMVNLSSLVRTITAELRQSEPERDVEFSITPRLTVKGDKRLIEVALRNLLGNAWKFSRNRERTKIEFGHARTNGHPVYFIRDNGVGFDMAYADKLFGPFQRLHSPKEFEGSGIGLATVQRIIHRHGGRIWAESTVDQGATFYFSL